MTTVKVIELVGTSEKSWEDAVEQAVKKSGESVRNVKGADAIGFSAKIDDGKITEFRANVKLAFVVD